MSGASFTERAEIKGSAADLRAWSLLQPTIGRCLFCPNLKPWTGTAQEVSEQAALHRAEHHPEAKRKRRRKPKAAPLRLSFNQPMNEDEQTLVEANRRRRMHMLGIEGPA